MQKLRICVFYGSKHTTYHSYITPLIGDIFANLDFEGEEKKLYIVTERLLHTGEDYPEIITITVSKK